MRRTEISSELASLAFDFFYWFSRFEYGLKELGFLRDRTPGAKAEIAWRCFFDTWEDRYRLSPSAEALIAANPQMQVIDHTGADMTFRPLVFADDHCDLERVVRLAQAVRNNLFHGGKHGSEFWDDPKRMKKLLPIVIQVLDDIAAQCGFQDSYRRYY